MYSVRGLAVIRDSHSRFELRVPELDIARGEKVAVVGSSGCGKSTLLDVLAFISMPSRSQCFVFSPDDDHRFELDADARSGIDAMTALRRRWLGYVLQTGGLIPFLTVRRNIGIARELLGMPDDGAVEETALDLGIDKHLDKMPENLSVGERQRVAIARALCHRPAVVIADEPTAALDPMNSDRVMELFVSQVEKRGTTLIVASHDVHRVERFGMRCLQHELRDEPDQGGVVSLFHG